MPKRCMGKWHLTGIDCKADLKLGQTVPPPDDAIVRYQEGIEHVFARQISKNAELAKTYGYKEGMDMHKFSWDLADLFARVFGYINENGKEIRVSLPDVAAYQLRLESNKLAVYEYFSGRIIDVRKTTTFFKMLLITSITSRSRFCLGTVFKKRCSTVDEKYFFKNINISIYNRYFVSAIFC